MSDKVPPDEPLATRTEAEGATVDLPEGLGFFTTGQVLGDRYEILEMLGRGGMGEVWRAFDLKLRVEVGLKALREELFQSERRLELLRQEVRAAREVVSPNVCRIFDLIEIDGRELVSMEYVDGATLLGVLQEHGPLELKEAQDIASQFLAGLEAIHKAGLVHRDVKPENIMLTRAGRVVVMDFGLARQETEGGGSVSGTPAYMAPEHAAGQTLDARADVYSAGVVLAEMVSPEGVKSYESRQSVWEGVRSEPAQVPDSPWAPVIKRAVARDRERRQNSAHTLIRELEDVTLRVEGAEDLHPYPGLASFTEEDAEYFFGREAEIEQMWRKLDRPHLLGIVGPSGAGKTSFIRAGVIPNAGSGWAIVTCNPGNAAFLSLGRALIPELSGNTDAMEALLQPEDLDGMVSAITNWRGRHEHALLIVDQFEELFTQNAVETQARFAELLGRLVLEADVFVLLSMRDDFFFHCHQFESLKPVVTDLTLLGPPTGAALRRALVQPATKCGYRFEDDELVEEILAEVEGERGALPLLAFALAQMWEKRDRDTGILTRQAYHDIGGVGGALARHAESTVDRIGVGRIPVVRELFRNLVTAEGTRAVREWDELLSIFSDSRSASQEVLSELIDARLLTSYEVREDEHEPIRLVEIIHESLLANWPRLVRWQTKDADAAQLRDQLRQAAGTWDEQGRTDDTLWVGSAYREFSVWREGYPGGLTEVEEAFAAAMTAHAKRSKRRRRIAVAAAFIVLLAVLGIVGVSRQQAIAEANRAEASKLLALAQVQLEKDATEALAYATASLELADTEEARVFAMKALWRAPPALVLAGAGMSGASPFFSPDGTWLAAAGSDDEVLVWPKNGGEPLRLPGHTIYRSGQAGWTAPGLLVTGKGRDQAVRVWSMPEGRLVRTIDFSSPTRIQVGETHLFAEASATVLDGKPRVLELRRWKLPDGQAEDLGSIDWTALGGTNRRFDPSGRGWIFARGDTIYYRSLPLRDDEPVLVIGSHDNDAAVMYPRTGEPDRIWSLDMVTGERRCWSLSTPSLEPLEMIPAQPEGKLMRYAFRSGTGTWRPGRRSGDKAPWLWDFSLLPGGQPLELRANTNWYGSMMDMHPEGKWLVASTENWDQLRFWPLTKTYPSVVEGYSLLWKPVVFSPDGEWLATRWGDGSLRLWPLPTGEPRELQVLEAPQASIYSNLDFDRAGERLVTTGANGLGIFVVSLSGGTLRHLEGFSRDQMLFSTAFSPSGRLVAAGAGFGTGERKVLRVWDLETGEVRVFDLEGPPTEPEGIAESRAVETGWENCVFTVLFENESTLLTAGAGGVRRWNLETGTSEVVIQTAPEVAMRMTMSDDQATLLTGSERFDPSARYEGVAVHHLAAGTSRALDLFGDRVKSFTTDPTGEVLVTGDMEGIVRVGRIDADEPHFLLGHEQAVDGVAISPDLEWIVSAGQDETLRLWPMPDLTKPPLHTLPREELIAKLKTLTNLRVVRDPESSTGWKVEIGPFPGWETVPEW